MIKKSKRVNRSRSTASTDTTTSVFAQQTDELDSNKKPKRILRNESTAITKPIKQTKTKAQVYSLFLCLKR
jgi:hypothetical protein